ncbi:TniQ family protein [Micromonospora inositola]|uniref:TniQ protein n=1 Tax=Micromonospora inositola TaxID=47865 RepID=A0A1C5JR32_9ACTN|nr:TniQ family protein [Micromonospora inositola]SCG72476.1 TniQ protein [Micromonospora inositola]
MTQATDSWLRGRLRRLPRRVPPVHDETLESYIGRLAANNHLSRDHLVDYLTTTKRHDRRRNQLVSLDSQASVSGFAAASLAHALPEMRLRLPEREARPFIGQTVAGQPNRQRPWCRLCAAAKGIIGQVTIWARCDYSVCIRHQLWVGRGVWHPHDQLDVSDFPEITRAQVRLRRRIRRLGHARVSFYYLDACEVEHWVSRDPLALSPHNDRMKRLFAREQAESLPLSYVYAAQYPEVVNILTVISSPFWRRMALSRQIEDRERFHDEIDRKTKPSGIARGNRRLRTWIDDQRHPPLPDDPYSEKFLRRLYLSRPGVLQAHDPADDQPRSSPSPW